ncbi:LLM class flavin-dependent oxidoreductase [Acrocarpospora catenulata]|uniref:LLM class flavin-dependent oxidoreductase n=1 Tax=Acrocarpospora catenulata TaxID=2836182 RepID=UPI001BDA5DE4|nr:LLM class flavin-dependent oxidoreductase [Acrocarpospora catenulata]
MSDLDHASVLLSNIPDADELLGLAGIAAGSGYRRAWLAETGGLEASALAAVIARTTPLEVGTAIVPVYSRSPALLSMMASTWSHLGGGRPVHLGIGAGGQVIVERWHGVPFEKPATTTRETLRILRQAFAGTRTDVTGRTRRSSGFRLTTGAAPAVRLYVGGMGPAMLDLAAEVADGLIVTWLSPRVLTSFRESFSAAVEGHGRGPDEVRLVARAYVAVTDTVAEAREEVRKELVEYVVSPPYARYFASVGFADEVARVNEAFAARERAAAVAAVSDRLLDEVLVAGKDAADIAPRVRAYVRAGADDVMIQPVPASRGGDPARTITAVAEALG